MTRKSRSATAPRVRTRRWLFWLVVGLVAAALYAVEVPVAVSVYAVPIEVVFVVVAAHVGAIPLAVWRPREASVVAIVAAFVLALISTTGSPAAPWPWAVAPLITQVLALAIVAWKDTWWWAAAAWLVSGAASLLAALILITRMPFAASLTDIVVFANIGVFTIAAAIVVRQLQRTRAQLADERETSESERSRRMMADERARIARELHDVVAHGMSILNVQATSAPYRHPGLPAEVVTEFEQIAAQTRTTLGEMRRLLGVLRSDTPETATAGAAPSLGEADATGADAAETDVLLLGDDPHGTNPTAVLEPQPGLAQLPALIEKARRAGASIEFEPGEATGRPVDDVVGLSAYRIVQEALSNALRHAPGAAITITVTRDSRMLELAIENAPAPRAPQPARRESGPLASAGSLLRGVRGRSGATGETAGSAAASAATASGYGLRGMRERAGAVGGSVEYGPIDGGGWRVDAVLPAHPEGGS
ncbi:sensor histidine kinase [Gryllotalpicola reticulitermitis]|uniref:histidine kinase n=1 Tax=Gryllotalpicola reticulitermitis TaxID=1184153 RepID=A0ABV8Q6J8_9MICO